MSAKNLPAVPSVPTAAELARIKALDTPALLAEFMEDITDIAGRLLRLAFKWKELETRGEDLSGFRTGLAAYLPLVAAGTVVPEAIMVFGGDLAFMRAVSCLSPDEQRRLAKGGTVKLVVHADGEYTHRMLPIQAMTKDQLRQVIDTARRTVRNEQEQIAMLTAAMRPRKVRLTSTVQGRCGVDTRMMTVRIGRSVAPASEMIGVLKTSGLI